MTDLEDRLQTLLQYAPNVSLEAALRFIREQDGDAGVTDDPAKARIERVRPRSETASRSNDKRSCAP